MSSAISDFPFVLPEGHPLRRGCPTCGASAGATCLTESGKPSLRPHPMRRAVPLGGRHKTTAQIHAEHDRAKAKAGAILRGEKCRWE